MISRRTFLKESMALTAAGALPVSTAFSAPNGSSSLHLACNQYVWHVFYQRDGKDLQQNLDGALGEMTTAGIDGYEPSIGGPAEIGRLMPLLEKHRLEMRSIYVNSVLHDAGTLEQNLSTVLEIGGAAARAGVRIIVTNPSPIQWGGGESKDDHQLERQAEAMNRLGKGLKERGLKLAYHNHDIELRQAAREFHHMMAGTDPGLVHLCLDSHWIYRGSGNSQVALFDVVRLYGARICELHLRQSRDQVWTETLCDGDIDHPRLVRLLAEQGVHPHLVLEQAVEAGTPHTMNALAAHQETVAYARRVFAPLG
jgi:inosose dehydratase